MTATPVASFPTSSSTDFLGSTQSFTIQFHNDGGAGDTGYEPYVDVTIPTGSNGVSFDGASFLGEQLSTSVISSTATAETVRIYLPFGSYQAGQTAADIKVQVSVPATATVGGNITISATSGFLMGNQATTGGTPIVQSGSSTYTITPAVMQLVSYYTGPQSQAATGPTSPLNQAFVVTAAIAQGQVVANLLLTDPLPVGTTLTSVTLSNNGSSWTYTLNASTGVLTFISGSANPPAVSTTGTGSGPWVYYNAGSNSVEADFGTVTGTATTGNLTGPTISTSFYVDNSIPLGQGMATAVGTQDITVTDNLPYGAAGPFTFSVTDRSGNVWNYNVSAAGVVTLASTTAAASTAAPAIETSGAGATGGFWVWYDAADGKILFDSNMASNGQTASIAAAGEGGQAQTTPGVISATIAAGSSQSNYTLTDQLANGAQASSFTLVYNGVSYLYDVSAGGVVTYDAGNPAGGPGVGVGGANANGDYVSWNAAASRIQAHFGSISGGASGQTVSITAVSSGGQVYNSQSTSSVSLTNAPAASGSWNSAASGTVSIAAGNTPGSTSPQAGANSITAEVLALQKSVSSSNAKDIPGTVLTWSLAGEVSSYADINQIVLTDTLGDGQSFDAAAAPTVTVYDNGHTYNLTFDSSDMTVGAKAADGSTTITLNVSQALIEAGDTLGDIKGSTSNASYFVAKITSTIDAAYSGTTEHYTDSRILENDSIGNAAMVVGDYVGTSNQVGDSSSAGVTLPSDSIAKTILAIDGVAAVAGTDGNIHLQTGESVTYDLKFTMSLGNADSVSFTDYLPQPVFDALKANGFSASSFYFVNSTYGSASGQSDGEFQWGTANSYNGATPTITVDAATNSITLTFSNVHAASYSSTTIDVTFTVGVTSSLFAQGLYLTNEVTASETNSTGAVSQQSAIVKFELDAPEVTIEKAVVATSDSKAVFTGSSGTGSASLGGVSWNAIGSSSAWSGTLNSSELAAAGFSDQVANLQGGDIVEYALVVQNLGQDTNGAWYVQLHDSAIPAGESLVAGSIKVYSGNGTQLTYKVIGGGLFDPNGGIEILGPNGSYESLAAYDASSGGNVAVVTYELQLDSTVATPNKTLPDTATLTNFSEQDGLNRISTITPAQASASSAVVTATPTITKTYVSSSEGDAANALKIGETITYDITVTLPEGSASNFNLGDYLSSHLSLVSAKILAVGGNITSSNHLAAGATSSSGSFSFGTVVDSGNTGGSGDQITIEVTEVALGSDSSNGKGSTRSNTGTVSVTNQAASGGNYTAAQTANITLASPVLSLTKQVEDLTTGGAYGTSISARAGDTLQYKVVLTNSGNATAYQVQLQDLLNQFGVDANGNAAVTLVSGSETYTYNGATGVVTSSSGVAATLASLAAGGSITVIYDVTVSKNEYYGTALKNTATASGQTLPSTDVNYATTGYDKTLTASATATATTVLPSITKTVIAASDSSIALGKMAIGETSTFQLTVAVPEGNSADLVVVDQLPSSGGAAELAYIAGSAKIVSESGSIGNASPIITYNAANNTVTFDFGAETAATAGSITVSLQAQLTNIAANSAGSSITNNASVQSGGSTKQTGSTSITEVAPKLDISKTNTTAAGSYDAGKLLSFDITVTPDAASSSAAYGAVVTDVLPADEVNVTNVMVNGVAATATYVNNVLTVTLPSSIAAGSGAIHITYNATVANSATPGETLTDTASVTYYSQPSGTAGARTYSSGNASATQTVALTPAVVKAIASVSDSNITSSGTYQAGATDVADGEQITYALTVTAGHGTQHLIVTDNLPSGMSYVSYSLVNSGGYTAVGGGALAAPSVTVNANGTVTLDFGTVVNAAGNGGSIVVDVVAKVNSTNTTGAILTNSASVTSSAPGSSAGSVTATSNNVSADVVAPKLTIGKTAAYAGNAVTGQAGSVVNYSVTVAPASNDAEPAYNVTISDALSQGLSLNAGSVVVSQNGVVLTGASVTTSGGKLTVVLAQVLSSSAPIVISYSATLADSVVSGTSLPNTAVLTYSTAPSNGASLTGSASASVATKITDSVSKTLQSAQYWGTTVTGEAIAGEYVTYYITATLGDGTQTLTLSDALQSGLTYVSSSVVSLGNSTGSTLSVGASGAYGNGKVSFSFGTLTLSGSNTGGSGSQVVIAVTEKVNGTATLGSTQTDTATLVSTVPSNSYGVTAGTVTNNASSSQTLTVVAASTIAGRVFVDGECNGLYHIGDAVVAGVTVELEDSTGKVLATTMTDSNGSYSFTNVVPANYKVQYVLPQGLGFTTQNAGGSANSAINSAADQTSGTTGVISVTGGQTITENAGVKLSGNIPGAKVTTIGANQNYDVNSGSAVVVGSGGGDNVHLNSNGSSIVITGGGNNIVEANQGSAVIFNCGTGQIQALGPVDYVWSDGAAGSNIQGGSGIDYLMGGTGNDRISGGGGTAVIIGGGNNGTVSQTSGVVTNYSIGDDIFMAGQGTLILFQQGDGVDMLENYHPGHDKLVIYGYSSFTSIARVNGHTVLYLGNNDAIVLNGGWNPTTLAQANAGVTFVASSGTSATATLSLHYNSNGTVSLTTPDSTSSIGSSLPTLSSIENDGTLTATAINQRLIASDGSFNLVGYAGGNDVFIAGTGSDSITMSGSGNIVALDGGVAAISGGAGGNDTMYGSSLAGVATIGNFVAAGASHDIFDIDALLKTTSWDQLAADAYKYVSVSTIGGNTVIGVNLAGAGSSYTTIATLQGVTGQTLSGMVTAGTLHL